MKKKGLRFVSLALVLSLVLSVFALTACTDKKEPRVLDDPEKRLVGTWRDSEGWGYDFYDDGTFKRLKDFHPETTGEFFHDVQSSIIDGRVCETFKCYDDTHGREAWSTVAVFADEPDSVYAIVSTQIDASHKEPLKKQ